MCKWNGLLEYKSKINKKKFKNIYISYGLVLNLELIIF